MTEDSHDQNVKRPPRSSAEWVSFIIASVICATIAGLVVYSWLTERDRPPVLKVEAIDNVREENGQFYIPFEVTNVEGQTVESVQIIAELEVDNEIKEAGDLEIDFLTKGEKEKGAFVFRHDPQKGKLRFRIAAYRLP